MYVGESGGRSEIGMWQGHTFPRVTERKTRTNSVHALSRHSTIVCVQLIKGYDREYGPHSGGCIIPRDLALSGVALPLCRPESIMSHRWPSTSSPGKLQIPYHSREMLASAN